MLALLLVGFFLIGQKGNTAVRTELEDIADAALDTVVEVGHLDLNVYGSHVHVEDIEVTDPAERSKALFRAEDVDVVADLAGFAAEHVILRSLALSNAYLRVALLPNGELQFLTDTTVDMSAYEPSLVRAARVITWATDQVNPFHVSAALPGENDLPRSKREPAAHYQSRTLDMPRGGPDLVIQQLSVDNGTIEITTRELPEPLTLHTARGMATGISSKPREHTEPIAFSVAAFFGRGTEAWLAGDGTLDLRGGRTNVSVRFAVSNIALNPVLPLAKLYSQTLGDLAVAGGMVDARGQVTFKNGVIMPTSLALNVRGLTASAQGDEAHPWLNGLAFNNATLDTVVPIDNNPPYVHFDTAFAQRRMKTKMENVDIRINLQDVKDDFLDGMLR